MQACLVLHHSGASQHVQTVGGCSYSSDWAAEFDIARLYVQSPQQLEVPPQGASAELEGLTGVWAAVKCLVTVGSSNVDLIRSHAR